MSQFTRGILLAIPAFAIFGCGGITETVRKDSHLVGKVLTTKQTLFYQEKCNNLRSCYSGRTAKKIDRVVECVLSEPFHTSIYNQQYEIEYEKKFEIKNVIGIACYGLQCAFSSDYELAVLEETRGRLSTKPLFSIDPENNELCLWPVVRGHPFKP